MKERNDVIISVKNFNGEISPEIKAKIFNGMVTTKGKYGTGIGHLKKKLVLKKDFLVLFFYTYCMKMYMNFLQIEK